MIVVDTSALISMLTDEADAVALRLRLAQERRAQISAVNFLEAATVAQRWGDVVATLTLDQLLAALAVEVTAVDREIASVARTAYLKFGKGRGHPAQLNICDCFSYALAKSLDAPLLFRGDDFTKTDIKAAA